LFDSLKNRARRLKLEVRALALAYQDPRTPWYAKAFAGCIVAYALSPIDLIPDFIPVLGYLDDIIIVPLGIVLAIKMIPADVLADCRAKARQSEGPQKPVNWAAAATIIAVWIFFLVVIAVFFVRRWNT
jgi:uncharacterized membrane protein YkvA (DUF1232 family)